MADTRINALTTSTVSISDDFLPIDGTTAGTKKLSAYSPSFGGAVTVGGTLTVSGAMATNSIVVNGFSGISLETAGSASLRFSDSSVNKWWIYKLPADANLYFRDALNARMQMIMTPGATASTAITDIQSNAIVSSTTASSSTITGALVVGSGGSGGLGVAGAIYAGGNIQCNAVFASNNTTLYLRPQGASVSAGQAILETSGNFTLNGDLGFNANNTYDVGSTTNRARSVYVRDLIVSTRTPSSATDVGTAGMIGWDASYIYVCTATNTWKRAALSTW